MWGEKWMRGEMWNGNGYGMKGWKKWEWVGSTAISEIAVVGSEIIGND